MERVDTIGEGAVLERVWLVSGRVRIALDRLADAPGTPLLLLHALRAKASDWVGRPGLYRDGQSRWPGPVYALHFSGHGASEWIRGCLYTPEALAGDADHALEAIEAAHPGRRIRLAGEGVGAYAGLLLAGARPESIEASLLFRGAGLDGGAARPNEGRERTDPGPALAELSASHRGEPCAEGFDPAVAALERDVRPVEYAGPFARRSCGLLLADDGGAAPEWWLSARALETVRVVPEDPAAAFAALAAVS